MKCPNDNTQLKIKEENGIALNFCPECMGVWLSKEQARKVKEFSDSLKERRDSNDSKEKPYYPQVQDFKSRGAINTELEPQHPGSVLGRLFDTERF